MRKEGQTGSSVGRSERIDPSARISESILWDDVEVGAEAVVDQCIVTDGVSIPAHARYERVVLMAGESGSVKSIPR